VDRAAALASAAARVLLERGRLGSIECRCGAFGRASVQRRRPTVRRALRRTGPRPPAGVFREIPKNARRHCGPSWHRRSGRCASHVTNLASEVAKCGTFDRTPLLRFLSPSALAATSRCRAMPSSRRSRFGVDRPRRPPSPLMRRAAGHRASRCLTHRGLDSAPHRTVHPRTGDVGSPLRFYAWPELARSPLRRSKLHVLAGTLQLIRRVAASFRVARRGSCAGRYLSDGVPLPADTGHVAWSGPFRRRSFLWFPSRELGRRDAWSRGPDCHACDGVAFDALSRRRSWGFRLALRRFDPAIRAGRAFPPARTHLPLANLSVAVF
jgi:hypothetical protein